MMKMEYFKKVVKESIIILIISSLLGLISGTVLSLNEEILYSIPIILLTLPALNSLIGDISIVLVSRLTTHLYIGTIAPEVKKSARLKEDFIGLFLTIIFSFGTLMTIGYIFLSIVGKQIVNPFIIIIILSITVLILFVILFIILFIFSIFLFKKGKDPLILIPLTTSLIDFLTPLLIIILIIIFI